MAERKLNINAPLLSVRRFSMKSSSSNGGDEKVFGNSMPNRRHTVPSYKSDSTLDQVTEPVAVPFMWEQIPGRRKGGNESPPEATEEASITPRLPPGRVVDTVRKPLGKDLNDPYEDRLRTKALPSTENATKFESFKEGMNERQGRDLEKEEDCSSDAYSDALETLSLTESFSKNCSVTGLSSSDGLDVKPSGTFSTDPQIRDFMLSRFLPAAKAMALQPAPHASKKHPVVPQEPRQDNMVVAVRRPSPNKQGSVTIPYYGQYKEEDSGESEDEGKEHYDSGYMSAKGCGLFPRLCLRNSLCLLNPVPEMKVRTQVPVPGMKVRTQVPVPGMKVRTQVPVPEMKVRTQVPVASKPEVEKPSKAAPIQAHSQSFKKDIVLYKHKSGELPKITPKVTGVSKRFSYSGNLQTMGRLSPSRRSGGISPYRREAPQSPFRGVGFLGVPKEVQDVKSNQSNSNTKGNYVDQKLLYRQRIKQGSGSVTSAVEKTLYVDTVNTAEIPCSSFSDTKEQMEFADEDSEMISESRRIEAICSTEFSFQDIKCLDIVKGDSGSVEAYQSSLSDISLPKGETSFRGFRMDEGLDQETKLPDCTKLNHGENLNHRTTKVEDSAIVKVGLVESSLPPPLPKSPSESWLWRTLPSVPFQNSHSSFGTQFQKRKQDIKTSSTNTKWETIVKTSNPHHDHARYSQELITHVSQPYYIKEK